MVGRKAGKKLITEGAKKVVTAVRGRGRPKGSTNKPKTVKRSEAPIQSERSKITAANATAANTRQSKSIANKAFGSGTAGGAGTTAVKKASTGASRPGRGVAATSIAGGAALTLMNKKGSSAPAKVTFADAFREARAKGEGTKFTHDGKPYVAVTKTDLKKKGYDDNELGAYNKRGGKARGPLNRLGQGVKKVLLGKDKKFGGDKGAIDFIRKPVKKAGGGMMRLCTKNETRWKCRWCRQLSKRRSKKNLPSKNSTFASSITSCTENCTRLRSSSRFRKSS
jgi:hypothetical protein